MWHFGTKERPCVNCEGVSPTLIVKLVDFPQKDLTFHCSTSLSFLSEARCWGGARNLCIGDQDKCPDHIPQSCSNKFLNNTFLQPRALDQEWNQWLHGVSSSSSFRRGARVGAVQQNLQPLATSLATKVFCKLQKSFVAVTGVSSPPPPSKCCIIFLVLLIFYASWNVSLRIHNSLYNGQQIIFAELKPSNHEFHS